MKRYITYEKKSHRTNTEGKNVNTCLVGYISRVAALHTISTGYVILAPEVANKIEICGPFEFIA